MLWDECVVSSVSRPVFQMADSTRNMIYSPFTSHSKLQVDFTNKTGVSFQIPCDTLSDPLVLQKASLGLHMMFKYPGMMTFNPRTGTYGQVGMRP